MTSSPINRLVPPDSNDDRLMELIRQSIGPRDLSDSDIESLLAPQLDSPQLDSPLLEPGDETASPLPTARNLTGSAGTESPADTSRSTSTVPAIRKPASLTPSGRPGMSSSGWLPIACGAACLLGLAALLSGFGTQPDDRTQVRSDRPAASGDFSDAATQLAVLDSRLVPGTLTEAEPVPAVEPGAVIETGPKQRRRVRLSDGSTLFVNSVTRVLVETARRVNIPTGQVYIEVAQQTDGSGERIPFEVVTPTRKVTALGTHFSVASDPQRDQVLVTQGRVRVTGVDQELTTGDLLESTGSTASISRGPRTSTMIDWTRDLMTAATGRIVPESPHAGGSLITVDSQGQETKLTLHKYHVDVFIEDGFARTTIDQTYFNETWQQLEGTFRFPLPADASISRLAMYVNGKLMEGGMAERQHARNTFEQIRHQRKDPALLEWVDGSTFKMRVFPLEPRQEKRIVLSYTQRIESSYGKSHYRFPAGHSLQLVRQWSTNIRLSHGGQARWTSPSHTLEAESDGADLVLQTSLTGARLDRDLLLEWTMPRREDEATSEPRTDSAQLASAVLDGYRYLSLRMRPELPKTAHKASRHWTILFERTADRDPLLARAQIELVRGLLSNVEYSDTFTVIAAGADTSRFHEETLPCTTDHVAKAITWLESTHLIGALDLGQAFTACSHPRGTEREHCLIHIGSGLPVLGERNQNQLLERLPAATRYVGIGVGHRWNQQFMKLAAEKTGGLFAQVNPDEKLAWRAFELLSAFNAPRLQKLRIEAPQSDLKFLQFTDSLLDGDELFAVTRIPVDARPPRRLVVQGVLDGTEWSHTIRVETITEQADYLPRTWSKLEIDRLVAESPVENRDSIVALSKSMYVMSPFTSLLVLENDEMYTQFNVDRGRTDHWAMYDCPRTIDVELQPAAGAIANHTAGDGSTSKRSPQQIAATVLTRASCDSYGITPTIIYNISSNGQLYFWGVHTSPRRYGVSGLGLRSQPPHFTQPRILIESVDSDLNGVNDSLFNNPQQVWLTIPSVNSINSTSWSSPIPRFSPDGNRFIELNGDMPLQVWVDPGRTRPQLLLNSADQFAFQEFSQPSSPAVSFQFIPRLPSLEVSGFDFYDPASLPLNLNLTAFKFRGISESVLQSRWLAGGSFQSRPVTEWLIPINPASDYSRPNFAHDPRFFFDLIRLAPGLQTTAADRRSIVRREAAAKGRESNPISPDIRRLIQRTRNRRWEQVLIPSPADRPAFTIQHDGVDRFRWDRQLASGLREQVVCDGHKIWHVYPEIGLASVREWDMNQFETLSAWIPWLLPDVDMLADTSTLTLLNDLTVVVTPAKDDEPGNGGSAQVSESTQRLVFSRNGRLRERLVVDAAGKTVRRIIFHRQGQVRIEDSNGQVVSSQHFRRALTEAPGLNVDLKGLVTVPMPYRDVLTVQQQRALAMPEPVSEGTDSTPDAATQWFASLDEEDAVALMVSALVTGNSTLALDLYRNRFHARGDQRIGFAVLLACSHPVILNPDDELLPSVEESPLAQFLRYHVHFVHNQHNGVSWDLPANTPEFIRHRARAHNLIMRWRTGQATENRTAAQIATDVAVTLAFINDCGSNPLAWCTFNEMQLRLESREDLAELLTSASQRFLAIPEIAWHATRGRIISQINSGNETDALESLAAYFDRDDSTTSITRPDSALVSLLCKSSRGKNGWTRLVARNVDRCLERGDARTALMLVFDAWQQGLKETTTDLFDRIIAHRSFADEFENRCIAAEILRQNGQLAQALDVIMPALESSACREASSLWLYAAELADGLGRFTLALRYAEQAAAIEIAKGHELVSLDAVRFDVSRLLQRYEQQLQAQRQLEQPIDHELLNRMQAAADIWRQFEPQNAEPCLIMARILQSVSEEDLSWQYLTSPLAQAPQDSQRWLEFARQLIGQGRLALADESFAQAFALEQTNPEILLEHARFLQSHSFARSSGRTATAHDLLKQIIDSNWQPRFAGCVEQARQLHGQ